MHPYVARTADMLVRNNKGNAGVGASRSRDASRVSISLIDTARA